MLRVFFQFWFWLSGWKIYGIAPQTPKFLAIVGPHTSSWDFVMLAAARSLLRMRTHFLAKKELFRFPTGILMRAMGGYPVDRSKNTRLVDWVVNLFDSKTTFSIALAPEGTRSATSTLKSGFYHIARNARIPFCMVGIDYAKREIHVEPPHWPTADMAAELEGVKQYFAGFHGKHPEQGIGRALEKRESA